MKRKITFIVHPQYPKLNLHSLPSRVVSVKGFVLVGGKVEGQWISGVTFQFQCCCHYELPPCVVCSNPSLFTEIFYPCVPQDYVLK